MDEEVLKSRRGMTVGSVQQCLNCNAPSLDFESKPKSPKLLNPKP